MELIQQHFDLAMKAFNATLTREGWGTGNVKVPGLLRERLPLIEFSSYCSNDPLLVLLKDVGGEIMFARIESDCVFAIGFPDNLIKPVTKAFNHEKMKGLTEMEVKDNEHTITIEIDPNYVHDSTPECIRLLERIESGEVPHDEISTSQMIMASLAFDKNEWLPNGWIDSTEQELLKRLDSGQINAIKAFKQARI